MKIIKSLLLIFVCVCVSFALFACSNTPTHDMEGNEVTIDYANISEVSVLNPDRLETEGFLLSTFKISDIGVHIVYKDESSVDIPLTTIMVKAASQAKLAVAGTHTIECTYGGKFDFSFVLRLYTAVSTEYTVAFYDETGDSVIGTYVVAEGKKVTPPQMQTKEGYTLVGWKNKATGATVTDFTVNADTAFVAIYQPDYYEVNYYYTIGEKSILITTETVARGKSALDVAPEIPIVSGYSNGRWSDEEKMKSVGENNTDFYAVYDADKVLITFSYYKYREGEYYDYDVSWSVDRATEGVTPPDDADRLSDNVFLYWYVERDGKEIKTTFPYTVTGEMRFVAKYVSFDEGTPDLEYKLNEDNTGYVITGLKDGSDAEIAVIPNSHLDLPVIGVENGAFSDTSIKKFAVSANNRYFRANDGALYSVQSGAVTLSAYPVADTRTSFAADQATVKIDADAFKGAKYLETLTLPTTIREIGEGAFSECEKLATVNLPESTEKVPARLFKNSRSIIDVSFGSNVKEIGDEAFYGASSLRSVALPASLEKLGESVFVGCGELATISISGTNTNPKFTVNNGALYGYEDGKSNPYAYLYAYPSKYRSGNDSAEFSVNTGVQVIKKGAFYGAALKGIYIGSKKVEFEEYSVVCPLLVSVRFANTEVTMPEETFGEYKPEVFYVTSETKFKDMWCSELYESQVSGHNETEVNVKYDDCNPFSGVTATEKHTSTEVSTEVINGFNSLSKLFAMFIMYEKQISGYKDTKVNVKYDYCNPFGMISGDFGEIASLSKYTSETASTDVTNGFNSLSELFATFMSSSTEEANANYTAFYNQATKLYQDYSLVDFAKNVNSTEAGSAIIGITHDYYKGSENKYKEKVDDKEEDKVLTIAKYKEAIARLFGYSSAEDFIAAAKNLVTAYASYNANGALANGCFKTSNGSFVFPIAIKNDVTEPILTYVIIGSDKKVSVWVNNITEALKATNFNADYTTGESITNELYCKNILFVTGPDAFYNQATKLYQDYSLVDFAKNVSGTEAGSAIIGITESYYKGSRSLTNAEYKEAIARLFGYSSAEDFIAAAKNLVTAYASYDENGALANGCLKTSNGSFVFPIAIKNDVTEPILMYVIIGSDKKVSVWVNNITEALKATNFNADYTTGESISNELYCKNILFLTVPARLGINTIEYISASSPYKSFTPDGFAYEVDERTKKIAITAYKGNASVLEIPSQINGFDVVEIKDNVFANNASIKEIVFSDELVTIGNNAFANCRNLKKVSFGKGLKKVGENAFAFCGENVKFISGDAMITEVGENAFGSYDPTPDDNGVVSIGGVVVSYVGYEKTLVIPENTTIIAERAFERASFISEIDFSKATNLTEIKREAFRGLEEITEVSFPSSLKTIGDSAFYGCVRLVDKNGVPTEGVSASAFDECGTKTDICWSVENGVLKKYDGTSATVVLPQGITEIAANAFKGNSYMEKVIFPDSLTVIGQSAFESCVNLKEVALNDNLGEIGKKAFYGCDALSAINFSSTKALKIIASDAFDGTEWLASYKDDSIVINGIFYKYIGQSEDLHIQNSVSAINEKAFYKAAVKTLYIPESVVSIGDYAFAESEISRFNFGLRNVSLESIGASAFENCTKLTFLDLGNMNKLKTIGERAFYGARPDDDGESEIHAYILASVSKIGASAFEKSGIKTIRFADGSQLEIIDERTFADCDLLASAIFEGSSKLVEIRASAFENCASLKVFHNTQADIYSLGERAFYGASALANFKINEEELISVGKDCFGGNKFIGESDDKMVFVGTVLVKFNGKLDTLVRIPSKTTAIANSAFANNKFIETIVFETENGTTQIKEIQESAFENCSSLKSVIIPDSVTSIGKNAFASCAALTKADLGNGVTVIGSGAFAYCKNLTDITITSSVNTFDGSAFYGCDSLTEIKVSDSEKYYSSDGVVFSYVTVKNGDKQVRTAMLVAYPNGLEAAEKNYDIPENIFVNEVKYRVIGIADYAFAGCAEDKVAKITVNSQITTIGGYAFKGTAASVVFDENTAITEFSDYIFASYEGKEIKIPDSVTSIGKHAFEDLKNVKKITIPSAVYEIGEYAFAETSAVIEWSENTALDAIADYAFAEYRGETVTVPLTVRTIGKYAFSGITATLDIQALPTEIGEYAFYGYLGANAPKIPESVVSIGDYAFAEMTKIADKITINKETASIGAYVFDGVSATIEFEENSSLSEIGEYVFAGYTGTTITIPGGVTSIARYAFYDCENLAEVLGTDNVAVIGDYAFAKTKFNSFVASDKLKTIGTRAFYDCEYLTEIRFGKDSGITSVGFGAFENCEALEEAEFAFVGETGGSSNGYFGYVFGSRSYSENAVYVPTALKKVTVYGGGIGANAFYSCADIEEITIDENVSEVKEGAFTDCVGLKKLSVPYGGVFGLLFGASQYSNNRSYVPDSLREVELTKVSELSDNAFYECVDIKSVVLPESLEIVGKSAFYGCSALQSMNIGANVTAIGTSAFARCSAMKEIKVDKNNASYADSDGVLYAYSDGTGSDEQYTARIINYPQKKSGKTYTIGLKIADREYAVKSIDGYAFYYTSLEKVVLPESIESIGEWAFAYSSIKEITFREATKTVTQNAFTDCSALKKIYIEGTSMLTRQEDVYKIFAKASEVYVLADLADSVRESTYIYKNFTKLVSSTTGNVVSVTTDEKEYIVYYKSTGVTLVGLEVSYDDKACDIYIDGNSYSATNYVVGTTITLKAEPKEGADGKKYAFIGWFGNNELLSGARETEYTITNGKVTLSAKFVALDGTQTDWQIVASGVISDDVNYYVVSATDEGFASHTILVFSGTGALGSLPEGFSSYKNSVTSIIVEEGITSVPSEAFKDFIALENATLPQSLTSMGTRAFYGCAKLESVKLPENLTVVGESTFENCSALTSVSLGKEIMDIKNGAFKNTAITSITFPATINSVDPEAFTGANELKSITVDENLKSASQGTTNNLFFAVDGVLYRLDKDRKEATLTIVPLGTYGKFTIPETIERQRVDYAVVAIGNRAFDGCREITNITIPSSITSIGNYVFGDCDNLQYIMYDNAKYLGNDNNPYLVLIEVIDTSIASCTINEKTKIIYSSAFRDCSGLTSITIPDSVTSIGDYAFSNCTALMSITIPDNVTSIGELAFYGCSGLTSVTIGNSVTIIGDYAFYNCSSLTNITIPDSVTSIGELAFYGCSGLTSVTIGNSVTIIGDYAFNDCDSLTDIHYTGDIAGWCEISGLSNIMSSSRTLYIDGKKVEGELVIPEGVTSIPSYAFYYCNGLTSITIPDSVTSIGSSAFYYCSSLTSITIPDSVTSIGKYAFGGCTGLTNIIIPDSVTSIGNSAFAACRSLTSITIPDSVTSIGWGAFEGCIGLTSVTIGNSVTSIGDRAFYDCDSLTDIYYTGDIAGWCRISGLSNIMSSSRTLYIDGKEVEGDLVIPDSVTSIGSSAFRGCSGLTSITIPDSVTSIDSEAFSGCSGLTSITIPDNVTSIGELAFYGCSGLTSVTIGNSVTIIGDYAFYNCSSLTNITIPDSVTSIGENIFDGSGIVAIEMSANGKYVAISNVLYSYTTDEQGSDKATIVYNASGSTPPETVTINNKEYTVTNR